MGVATKLVGFLVAFLEYGVILWLLGAVLEQIIVFLVSTLVLWLFLKRFAALANELPIDDKQANYLTN